MEKDEAVKENARSWVVAACCCFCNLTFYGVSRLSGIMLVASTHTFQVSRASAAVPFSLGTAIRNLAGVFVGNLGHRFGVGPVVATGCLIASLGSGLCFLAKDIHWLTVCWGGIFGFGFGLCTCLLPLAINQNFSKHLGTASGISYSGSYIGSFIFPPAVVWLLDTFGLQGTFLIISGGVLNVLVAALLLKEPKKGRNEPTCKSPEDALTRDSHRISSNVQPYYIGVSELWKRTIHKAYLASQNNRLAENKQNFRHSISSEINPYFLQDRTSGKRFPEDENTSEGTCAISDILHSEINSHHRNLFPKLYETFESVHIINSESDSLRNIPRSIHRTSDFSLTSDTDCVHSTKCSDVSLANDVDAISDSAKQAPVIHRGYLKKASESNSLFRGNLKAKYKLSLQKLKKVLVASLLKHRSPYLKEFVLTENVKLTSFRYFKPFLCPKTYVASTPIKHAYLSPRQRVPGRKSTIGDVNNSSINPVASLQHGAKRRGRRYSFPMFELNRQSGLLPVISVSLFDRAKFLVISEERHEGSINNCDVLINKRQDCSSLFLPTNQKAYAISCNVHSLRGDAPIFTKSENGQHSHDGVYLSPELLLKDKIEFKAQKRKDTSSSQWKSSGSGRCFLEWLHMFRKPMFVIIGFTMSIQTFIVVCVVTTIEDYARDVGIPENRTHYALMALSIANLVGTLTLGSITDRGFISRHRFMFLCFLGMFLSLLALSLFAVSLPSLLSLVVIYGLLESGVIITFPLLTKQFVKGQKKQAVAIASSNVLSVPTVMLVPMLIGHFRDNIGSYSGLFQLLGATSLTCSLLWLVAPSICKKRKLKKSLKLNIEKC